jgi:hypothetical protein
LEWKPSKQWAVGASYEYGTTSLSNFNFQDTTSNISSNINSVNVYGVYRPDKHWKIAALFGFSDFSYSGSRTYLGDTVNAKYSASGYTAALQASYDIPLSRDYNNKKNHLVLFVSSPWLVLLGALTSKVHFQRVVLERW